MTKKDFVLIAGVLNGLKNDAAHCFDNDDDVQVIAERFAGALASTSPTFDSARFIAAVTK